MWTAEIPLGSPRRAGGELTLFRKTLVGSGVRPSRMVEGGTCATMPLASGTLASEEAASELSAGTGGGATSSPEVSGACPASSAIVGRGSGASITAGKCRASFLGVQGVEGFWRLHFVLSCGPGAASRLRDEGGACRQHAAHEAAQLGKAAHEAPCGGGRLIWRGGGRGRLACSVG